MRLRAAHLACVVLLLSSLGAADAHALARGEYARSGHYLGTLLQQAAAAYADDAFPHAAAEPVQAALPGEPVTHVRAAWPMQPPAAHTLAQHAATGSGL